MFKLKIGTSFMSALALSVVLFTAPAYTQAGIQDEMDKMFGNMTNVTNPGSFNTSRRGVISGGSFSTRNKIMNTSLIGMQFPSFDAGCGGIDFFGGSFSFINADQFVQLARSVASNAAGFAFFIALRGMSQEVAGTIENIQKKIQELNQFFGNSCQLAQGLVTDPVGAMNEGVDKITGLGKAVGGGVSDIFGSFTGNNGEAPQEGLTQDEKDKVYANLVWKAMQDSQTKTWYRYGDNSLLETIMSVTGTLIVNQTQKDGETVPDIRRAKALLEFSDLIEGGSLQVYDCDEPTRCMDPDPKSGVNVKGFKTIIEEFLMGRNGVMYNLRVNGTLQPPQEAFVSSIPNGIGGMLFRLNRVDPQLASNFASQAIEPLAIEMGYELVNSLLKSADQALGLVQDKPHVKEAMELLTDSRTRMYAEYQAELMSAPKLDQLYSNYNEILRARGSDGIPPSFSLPSSSGRIQPGS